MVDVEKTKAPRKIRVFFIIDLISLIEHKLQRA